MVQQTKRSTNKIMTMVEAITQFVPDGASFCLGGFIGRDSTAAVHEMIRQQKKDLIFVDDSKTDTVDLLVGAGCLKRWEGAYMGYGAIGLPPNVRRSVEKCIPHKLDVEDWSNAAVSMRFLAGSLNVPFMPTKSVLGSDIPKYNPRIIVTDDPYEGKPVALVPAARPDVAIVHVQRADAMGNAQVWGFTGNDENKVRAAHHTIITCEEVVSTEEIRRHANQTLIPFYCVDAVVHAPYGSHPQSCYGCYAYDVLFSIDYHEAGKNREGFQKWLKDYVFSTADHSGYLEKVGRSRLKALTDLEQNFNRLPAL